MTSPARAPLPTHITHEQVLAACEALGIDPEYTRGMNIRVGTETVTVVTYPYENGHRFLVGDHIALNTAVIPIAQGSCVDCSEQHTYKPGCQLARMVVGKKMRTVDTLGQSRRRADQAATWAMWCIGGLAVSYLVYIAFTTIVPLATICR